MAERVRASLFLSWCHEDAKEKEALLGRLHLDGLSGVCMSWWEDSQLLLGEDWRRQILARLDSCDYGLLLLSPGFFRSRFILEEELPRLAVGAGCGQGVAGDAEAGADGWLAGAARGGRAADLPRARRALFTETRGPGQERFTLELATKIRERVLSDAS